MPKVGKEDNGWSWKRDVFENSINEETKEVIIRH